MALLVLFTLLSISVLFLGVGFAHHVVHIQKRKHNRIKELLHQLYDTRAKAENLESTLEAKLVENTDRLQETIFALEKKVRSRSLELVRAREKLKKFEES